MIQQNTTGIAARPELSAPGPVRLERPVLKYEPTPQEKFFLDRVGEKVDLGGTTGIRWAQERTWYENILMVRGHQWIAYDLTNRRHIDLRTPSWVPKPVDNQLWPRVERAGAQFLRRPPSARVRPATSEGADREAARDGEALLGHIDEQVNEVQKRQLAAYTMTICGHVFSREWFDSEAGRLYEVPRESVQYAPMLKTFASCMECGDEGPEEDIGQPCPTCGEPLEAEHEPVNGSDGTPMLEVTRQPQMGEDGRPLVDRFFEGEIRSEILLPFEVFPDETADSLDACEWVAQVSWRPLAWIERAFPDRGRYVQEEGGYRAHSFYRSALLNVVAPGAVETMPATGVRMRGGAVVIDYEERPSRDFPDGMRVVIANNVLLHVGPLPCGDGRGLSELSFSDCRYSIVPGAFWGGGPVEQGNPLQRKINSIHAHMLINRKTMLSPRFLAPTGSMVEQQMQGRPGEIIYYEWNGMGTAPQQLPGMALPPQILEELQDAKQSLDMIFATEEVTMGNAPSGVKSGVALAQLGEQAETTHLPRMQRWEAFIASRGRKRLLLAQRYYQEPRLVKMLGAGSVWQVRRLTGADLRGNTDVTVEAGSSLPRSRMAQLQLILDLMQMGLLLPQEPGMAQKLLDEFGLTAITPEAAPDRRKALTENAMLDMGQLPRQGAPFSPGLPTVGKFEDHASHLGEHMLEVKDARFEQKPIEAQQAYLRHVAEHRFAAIIQMRPELQAQGMGAAPGGDEGGAGGQEPAGPAAPGGEVATGEPGAVPGPTVESGGGAGQGGSEMAPAAA